MNHYRVARSTILLGIDPIIIAEYMVVNDVKTPPETLA